MMARLARRVPCRLASLENSQSASRLISAGENSNLCFFGIVLQKNDKNRTIVCLFVGATEVSTKQ